MAKQATGKTETLLNKVNGKEFHHVATWEELQEWLELWESI